MATTIKPTQERWEPGSTSTLEQVKQQFSCWREQHKSGGHFPNKLWAAALDMAELYGIERTVQELGVNTGRLIKKREQIRQSSTLRVNAEEPQFIEMRMSPPCMAPACECIIEVDNAKGAKMRIQFKGHDTAELVRLSDVLWSRT